METVPSSGVVTCNKRRKVNEQGQEDLSDEFTIAIDALTSASQIIETRVSGLKEREVVVEKRIQEMEALEARLDAAEKRIENDTQDVVTLNVGGTTFFTSKATLLKHKGSYFEELIKTGQCLQEKTFVDRDPEEFSDILNFLRDGKFRTKKLTKRAKLEYAFYGILPNEHLTSPLQNAIRSWLPNRKFLEVYSGGKWPSCLPDVEGPLLVVIRSNGCLFGGYMSQADSVKGTYCGNTPQRAVENDSPSFIFTLTNPHGIPPTKYNLNSSVPGIPVMSDDLNNVSFGVPLEPVQEETPEQVEQNEDDEDESSDDDCDDDSDNDSDVNSDDDDMVVENEDLEDDTPTKADLNISAGVSHFPLCYTDTTGKGPITFTGAPWFVITELVIYSVSN